MSNADTPPFRRDLLLEHRAWVRALARSLVRDESAADDLAQDTLVRGLESMPVDTRSPRAWLATVLRNRSRDVAKTRGRRVARERSIGSADTAPPAADIAAQAETHRHVLDAVLRLDPPFRDVVLLRFFDGLAPAEIATHLGVPAATVRTRLHRALAKLRERLDADHGGDDRSWRAALAPLLVGAGDGTPPAHDGAPANAGRPDPLVAVAAALLVGAAAVVGVVLLATGNDTDVGPATDAAEVARRGAAAEVAPKTAIPRNRPRVDASAVALRTAEDPATASATLEPDDGGNAGPGAPRVLRVDVRQTDGAPAAGVRVDLIDGDSFAKRNSPRLLAQATTDAAGRTAFDDPPAGEVRVIARVTGLAAVGEVLDLHERVPAEPIRITLGPAVTLRGVVVAPDGTAVPGARLGLTLTGDLFGPAGAGVSDTSGRFAFAPLPAAAFVSPANVEVIAAGYVKLDHKVDATAVVAEQRIELRRAVVLRGRVVDANGRPVAGADVTSPDAPSYAETDADGCFVLGGIAVDDPERPTTFVVVESDAHAWLRVDVDAAAIAAGDLGAIVVLSGTPLRGRVVDTAGRPVAKASVWIEGERVEQIVANLVSDDDGRFVLPHAGTGDHTVHATAPSDDSFSGASGEIAGVSAGATECTVVVSHARSVLIEFVDDATGDPVALTNILTWMEPIGFEVDDKPGGGFSSDDGMRSVRVTAAVAGPYRLIVRDFEGWEDTVIERVDVRDDAEVRVTARMRRSE